jgi:dihydrofolate synthase/folylpolyglutamate synthase
MVIEVGIGGRLDTTNVAGREDKVAVITDIGLDHTELLGSTLGEIAHEKAGIITQAGTVVMHSQSEDVMGVVREVASNRGATVHEVGDAVEITVPLPSYQVRNSSLAVAAVTQRLVIDAQPPVTADAITQALRCVIPGRFEQVTIRGVPALLDAAHNPQKIQAFTEAYRQIYPKKSCILVVAFGENKSTGVAESLETLRGISKYLVVTEFTVEGKQRASMNRDALLAIAKEQGFEVVTSGRDPQEALDQAVVWARRHGAMVVVTGSFYLISALRDST